MTDQQINYSESSIEDTIIAKLKNKGFEIITYMDYLLYNEESESELLIKDVPYKTIYGNKGKSKFLLISKKMQKKLELNVSGSKLGALLMKNIHIYTLMQLKPCQKMRFF